MPTHITTVGSSGSLVAGATGGFLGKDDFLRMLVIQLRHQDPFKPMESTEFATQLAQFSSVEQLTNINATLSQSLEANYLLAQSIGNSLAAIMIGKDVRASSDAFQVIDGQENMRFGYTLSSGAETAIVKIYDESGNLVKTITNPGTSKGDNTITWDGTDESGKRVGAGKYTFTVEAKDSEDKIVQSTRYIFGRITGVRFKPEGAAFLVDGAEIWFANILEILGG